MEKDGRLTMGMQFGYLPTKGVVSPLFLPQIAYCALNIDMGM